MRPKLGVESLEARDLPAVLNLAFMLGDGSTGSAGVTYDETQVNPALASQQVVASDIQLTINGQPVALAAVATAASVSFTQGQLRGSSFDYDVSGDYRSLAVLDSSVVALTTTGVAVQGTVGVNGRQPDVGATPPLPIGTFNDFRAVIAYNNNVAKLMGLQQKVEQGLARFEELTDTIATLQLALGVAPDPVTRAGLQAQIDVLNAQLAYISALLRADYNAYVTEYVAVYTLAQALFGSDSDQAGVIPKPVQVIATPLPPPIWTIPPEYFVPGNDLV